MAKFKIEEIPTSQVNLPETVKKIFEQYKDLFNEFPELWIKGGAARETLVGEAKKIKGYVLKK